jgi:hypothetical protein
MRMGTSRIPAILNQLTAASRHISCIVLKRDNLPKWVA